MCVKGSFFVCVRFVCVCVLRVRAEKEEAVVLLGRFKGLKGHLPKTNNLFQLRGSEKKTV